MTEIIAAIERLIEMAREAEHAATYEFCTGKSFDGLRDESEGTPETTVEVLHDELITLIEKRIHRASFE